MALLIVGLGNPGDAYRMTRHNVGFLAVDAIATNLELSFRGSSHDRADIAEGNIDRQKIVLAKPTTFMNLSGEAIAPLAKKFHIEPKDIIVLYDEAAIPFGTIRIRTNGGSGGHNGIKSLIEHLGSDAFGRVRIGIGEAPDGRPLEDWVLARFSKEEQTRLEAILDRAEHEVRARLHAEMLIEQTIVVE